MYPGHTILSGAAPAGARRDWSPIAHPAEHDMLAHTPDPKAYHASMGGTMIPRSDHLGASTGFKTGDAIPVIVDATNPFDPSTGTVIDMAELRERTRPAPQAPAPPAPQAQAPQAQAGGPQLLRFNTAQAAPAPAPELFSAPAAAPAQPQAAVPAGPDPAALMAQLEVLISTMNRAQLPTRPPVIEHPQPPADGFVLVQPPAAGPANNLGVTQAYQPPPADGPLAILAGPPQRPRRPVVFRMPGGTYRQHFHHVSKRGNSIFLFYDDRYDGDSRFQPNPTGDDDEPITVILPEDNDSAYRVHVLPLSNNLDYVDIVQLLVCPEPSANLPSLSTGEGDSEVVDLMDLSPYGASAGA